MKLKIFILSIASLLSLTGTQPGSADSVKDPTVEATGKWCHEEEAKLEKNLKLPKDFDESKSGKLRAIVYFDVKGTEATNIRHVRKTKTNHADWPTITIPEKNFAEVETAMITAVKASQPLKPLPSTMSDSGVSFAFDPHGTQRIRVILFKMNP